MKKRCRTLFVIMLIASALNLMSAYRLTIRTVPTGVESFKKVSVCEQLSNETPMTGIDETPFIEEDKQKAAEAKKKAEEEAKKKAEEEAKKKAKEQSQVRTFKSLTFASPVVISYDELMTDLDRWYTDKALKESPAFIERAANWKQQAVKDAKAIKLTAEEISLMERLVECEVRGNDEKYYNGKLAIAIVILKRYTTDYWEFRGKSITEINYQKNQFSPIGTKEFETVEPTKLTKQAVADAVAGKRVIEPDVLFFCTLTTSNKPWFEEHENLEFAGYLHPHDFYSIENPE